MKYTKYVFGTSLMIFSAVFLVTRHQEKKLSFTCPSVAQASEPISLPTVNIPLKAILEISGGGSSFLPREIGVQLVPKQSNRPNSPLLIQLSSVELNDLSPGNYHFKVTLKRSTDDLALATLDIDSNVQAGSSVDFGKGAWNYDLDPDGDQVNTLTEIMNGKFEESEGSDIPNRWVFNSSNPVVGNETFKISLLRPAGISVMTPGPQGRLRVSGDPFTVQSAVYVKADLLTEAGVKKGSAGAYSRLDGSFDVQITSGAEVGDRVLVYTISKKILEEGDTDFDSSRADVGPFSKVEIVVKDLQACR